MMSLDLILFCIIVDMSARRWRLCLSRHLHRFFPLTFYRLGIPLPRPRIPRALCAAP